MCCAACMISILSFVSMHLKLFYKFSKFAYTENLIKSALCFDYIFTHLILESKAVLYLFLCL